MNSENTIAKTIKVASVIALMIGASGCATQGIGGSKYDNEDLANNIAKNNHTVQVCEQFGAIKQCRTVDRDQVREDIQAYLDSGR